jgi:hypothetical protein
MNAGGTAGRASGGTAGSTGGTGETTGGGEGGEAGATPGEGGTVNAGRGGTTGGVSGSSGSTATGGSAGTGEVAGSGGTAGTGDLGGMGGSAGTSAGMGGATAGASMGGMGGSSTVASGCANLTVPLANTGDKAHFVITLSSVANMTAATINMRVYVVSTGTGLLMNYVQDSNNRFMGSTTARPTIASLAGTWTTLTWNVGTEPVVNGIDKVNIKRVGIEVNGSTGGTLASTKIYVDSIALTGATPAPTTTTPTFPFDTSGTVATNPSQGVDVGGQVLWLNSNSTDTSPTAGVTLGWLTSCP